MFNAPFNAPFKARLDLEADCASCCGLCCVAPGFAASADFGLDKGPGEPCPHLDDDFCCRIHARLRLEGFQGCVAYDCHGAGQKVTQQTFAGRDWRAEPEIADQMFEAFMVMRQLHEQMMYLNEGLKLSPPAPIRRDLEMQLEDLERVTGLDPERLVEVDTAQSRRTVDGLLVRLSSHVRSRPAES